MGMQRPGWVNIRHPEAGSTAEVPADSLPGYQANGWVVDKDPLPAPVNPADPTANDDPTLAWVPDEPIVIPTPPVAKAVDLTDPVATSTPDDTAVEGPATSDDAASVTDTEGK